MTRIRRIVLDVLKPHDPSLIEFARHVTAAESVEAASASLIELDQEVQNITITVEGEAVEYASVESAIEDLGGTVHSIDHVVCGAHVVDEQWTPPDR